MCHKTRMNRAVGRCSVRMRQVPRQVFLFSTPSWSRTDGRTDHRRRQNHPRPCAQGVVRASFSWPPFPIFFPPCQLCSACAGGFVLSCLVLPCPFFACCQHANNSTYITHRGSTAQLPARLQILCAAAHPGRRANAAPPVIC